MEYVEKIEEACFEWFDDLWADAIKFAKEHPHHIFIPADEHEKLMLGFCSFWDHPHPGILACDLGIDISDIYIEKYWKISMADVRKSMELGRVPKEAFRKSIELSQNGKIEIAKRIVIIAKTNDTST
jgi:hypothetical protein